MTQVNRRDLTLAGIDAGIPVTGPETVHIDLVNACNTNCITCWDHSPLLDTPRPAAWKGRRVRTDDVERLLDDLDDLGGVRNVILSGMGEPFVHPGIHDVIAAVKRRSFHLTIITNLLLADVRRVLDLGVDQLLVGVHAASRRTYEAFHPSFGSGEWDTLLEKLRAFRDAGRRFKQVQVICSVNAHELQEMVALAAEMHAESVTFKRASLRGGTESCGLDEAVRRRLLEEGVPRAREAAGRLGVATNLDVLERQLAAPGDETTPVGAPGCFMGFAYARVTVDGDVLYCCDPTIRVGSISDGTPFSDLWRGAAWQRLRDRLRAGESLPGCAQCGKFNQNVALGRAFEIRYGAQRLLEVTGRA
ncbi:MAG: radical SAM protein [Holophagales bacterium]|nr:radical SAM protein [Holophagales bacterium]